ncbi:hypothetical protein CR492_07845 [Methylocella silvestris]|uniref:Uncharacterized protein n=1 Tax=Methylocella silvestris TaxID=199596 RepID=A0A2J7TII7_METSI|nr:hypothetical protein CR492_07845 [Methylocella silvestris]
MDVIDVNGFDGGVAGPCEGGLNATMRPAASPWQYRKGSSRRRRDRGGIGRDYSASAADPPATKCTARKTRGAFAR